MDKLLGSTIDPRIATSLLPEADPEAGPVRFDSLGKILGFSTRPHRPIPAALIDRLEAAVIQDPVKTNAHASAEAPRPERDLLVRAMHVLSLYDSDDHAVLRKEAKALFLSSSFDRGAVSAFLHSAAQRLVDDLLIQDQFAKLAEEATKTVSVAQLADNLYGRAFESFLVEDLVRNPPPALLKAAATLGQGMFDMVLELHSSDRAALMTELIDKLSSGARPWFGHSPSLLAFASTPSMGTLAACLADVSSGIEAVKVMHMAQRFVHSINDVSERGDIDQPDWYRRCLDFYSDFMSTQKPAGRSPLDLTAQKPGIWLHYHPNASTIENPGTGTDHTHSRVPDAEKLSLFEQDALTRGQTVVNGLSGQTGMVSFLAQHIAKDEPSLSMKNVHLGMLMTLVFNGGHSTEEVLATAHALQPMHTPGSTDRRAEAAFTGGYEALLDLAESEQARADLVERLERAVDRTVQYCAEHVI
ncbi:hypothetical protein [Acidovorax sp. NCPPB 4044]|uniref:hypothetical protein n=1 Tax=Acidovorax sp. NCPPB 4044 TaxID=2940490 RepID=UPI0023043CBC|nr:hypothetical protein [Acidovorax sp. NCPPB 4044]MDA8521918.1 hypothetical protein [Acidovorax sp. NCPPB 4044]